MATWKETYIPWHSMRWQRDRETENTFVPNRQPYRVELVQPFQPKACPDRILNRSEKCSSPYYLNPIQLRMDSSKSKLEFGISACHPDRRRKMALFLIL